MLFIGCITMTLHMSKSFAHTRQRTTYENWFTFFTIKFGNHSIVARLMQKILLPLEPSP